MIAILQPFIPHYRKDFFLGLKKKFSVEVFCYENTSKANQNSFNLTSVGEKPIQNISFGPFLIYNPFRLLSKKYNQLVLMLHYGHIMTWAILFLKPIHRKKIILWGQGISVKRYIKEEKKPSRLLKWMIFLADDIWFYTKKEFEQWQRIFPNKKMKVLNNTISGIENIVEYKSTISKNNLKIQYNINNEICFIFCARFNNNHRRQDLLMEIIENLNADKYGFIIVGDGPTKPDFSKHKNVYDYGAVYEESIKRNLFTIADLYLQPAWVGLSIVEAMGYAKPIITFKRSQEILQCVEYSYLVNGHNAFIFNNMNQLISKIKKMPDSLLKEAQRNANNYAIKNLKMENMINNASESLKK